MRVLVITGGIGAGKSTAAEFLREKGAAVIDADRVAAYVLEKGSAELVRVVEAFGPGVLLADGSLNRAALAQAAFSSREATARLNAIVHPAVAREIGPSIANLRLLLDPPSVVVIQVPLLAEAPVFAELADLVLAIAAPEEVRVARACTGELAESDVRSRLAVQATDSERAVLADKVIVNDGSKEHLFAELEGFWEDQLAVGERL